MATKRLVAVITVGLMILLLATVPVEALQILPPHSFFGVVTINGHPARDGTRVQGRIEGNVCGNTTTFTGGFGPGTYTSLDVVHSGEKAGCGDAGDIVEFFVEVPGFGFVQADQTAVWQSGENTRLDLTVTVLFRPVGGYGESLSAAELLGPWIMLLTVVATGAIAAVSLTKRMA